MFSCFRTSTKRSFDGTRMKQRRLTSTIRLGQCRLGLENKAQEWAYFHWTSSANSQILVVYEHTSLSSQRGRGSSTRDVVGPLRCLPSAAGTPIRTVCLLTETVVRRISIRRRALWFLPGNGHFIVRGFEVFSKNGEEALTLTATWNDSLVSVWTETNAWPGRML